MATVFPASQVVVVGGGLAGVSACNEVMQNGGRCVLVDKSAFCGGNSTKATSGINGAETSTQKAQGIEDTIEIFTSDCMKGGAKKPELVKVMAHNSGRDVDWLIKEFNLDLSLLARLGGHSMPRTHRGKERFPGMTITYALIQMVENIAKKTDLARILTKSRAHTLLRNDQNHVVGLVYEKKGQQFQEHGPVILASGGFGADFGDDSLLAKHRPDLLHLPTTNGEHCTGDAIKMGVGIGAKTIDLEWVQVHPTGLVKRGDEDAKVKFLAAEALRGVGGLVLNGDGHRFANELGRRDYVSGEMWKNKGPHRLCLNEAAAAEIIWHVKHYCGRGVMKMMTGTELAAEIGCPVDRLVDEVEKHNIASQKQEKDPEGGPYPAYPTGKCWDEASGKTGSGKKFYHNVLAGKDVPTQTYAVAVITPTIHYCMGGLEMTDKAEVVGENGAIPGLYVAGEAMGGVHGNNRLGGNSLLDCVVYGRVAGYEAMKYLVGEQNLKYCRLCDLAGCMPGEEEKQEPVAPAPGAGGAAAAPGALAPVVSGITMEEVAKHVTDDDVWVVVNGNVLDVTEFLGDHPGGKLAIMTFAGKDATEEFNMVHPPGVVEKYLEAKQVLGAVHTGPVGGNTGPEGDTGGGLGAPLLGAGELGDSHWFGEDNRTAEQYGPFIWSIGYNVRMFFGAIFSVVWAFVREILYTIFSAKNFSVSHDRTGLTRSGLFLVMFIVIHAIGNLHLYPGANHFNAYTYFLNHPMPWGTLMLPVELYLLLAGILHVWVATVRTYKFKALQMLKTEPSQLSLAFSGIVLFTFMVIHLQQFRFAEAEMYRFRASWMYPFFAYPDDTNYPVVEVRDLYKLEMELFADSKWVLFYEVCAFFFLVHGWVGWTKVCNVLGLPKQHVTKAQWLGQMIVAVIWLFYASYPIYCYFFPYNNLDWREYDAAQPKFPEAVHSGKH